jgi:LysM repeat protein
MALIAVHMAGRMHGEAARMDQPEPDWTKAPCNQMIIQLIGRMPSGGGYATGKVALGNLAGAVAIGSNGVKVKPKLANPSFCSGATYLVFAELFDELAAKGRINGKSEALARLAIKRQPDGVGVWGRWNANGPGVARLFYETGMGKNFESLEQALPGDFMKIFWTDEIGAKEFGHLVIFMGCKTDPSGAKFVSFWSSNKPDGYGQKEVPVEKIKWAVFSRLLHPEMFVRMPPVDSIDRDLANMQKLSFSRDQVRRLVGMPLIPAKGGKAPNVSRIVLDPPKEVPVVPRISGGSHVVKEGETISEIAVFHGVSVQSICLLNHIDSADHVKVGKLLKIPAK